MYSVTISGNVEHCRTEAEITDAEGVILAVVHEDVDGWHTEILAEHTNQAASDFNSVVTDAKEKLSHYVNRRGDNAPEGATVGALSLWLMVKDDGTAMGMNIGRVSSPD